MAGKIMSRGTYIKEGTTSTTLTYAQTHKALTLSCLLHQSSLALRIPAQKLALTPHLSTPTTILPLHLPKQPCPLKVSKELLTWLNRHGLGGYLQVVDAPSHPDA